MASRAALTVTIAIALATTGLAPTATAQTDTLVVDDDGVQCPEAGFSSIQAAVDASQLGDRVVVCSGVYDETVTIDTPDLTLCGAAPDLAPTCGLVCVQVEPGCPGLSATVSLDASASNQNFLITITEPGVTVRGLNVVAGTAQSAFDVRAPGVTLEDNRIASTATGDAVELRTIGVNAVAPDTEVRDNVLVGWIANAVGVWRPDATVTGNVFLDNRVGVHLADDADGTQIAANTFEGHLWPVRVAGEAPGLNVADNDLDASNAFAMRVEPDVDGLEVDAPNNWWGVLGCAAIQERIDDPEATSTVDVTPYRGPTGDVLGPEGLADLSGQDPTCQA